MKKLNAKITGIGGYVPDYVLNNEELSQMVDTSDEWIMTRIGIKERRILKETGNGYGSSYLGIQAVKNLLEKTNTDPKSIDLVVVATVTPDHFFPSTASIITHGAGLKNAWGFDLSAACSGFLYGMDTAASFIQSGRYKKVILVGADKMSAITDYTDRNTCPLFGDGAGAVLFEPTEEEIGLLDTDLHMDGVGIDHLYMKAGGSANPASNETIEHRDHYIYQDGQFVFKHAVSKMAKVAVKMMKKHNITSEELGWLVPHQANMRIIKATAHHMGITEDKVMINIQRYGNTTAATLPLALWDYEKQLKKGDNIVFATFGGGFTWGAGYLKWAYDGE